MWFAVAGPPPLLHRRRADVRSRYSRRNSVSNPPQGQTKRATGWYRSPFLPRAGRICPPIAGILPTLSGPPWSLSRPSVAAVPRYRSALPRFKSAFFDREHKKTVNASHPRPNAVSIGLGGCGLRSPASCRLPSTRLRCYIGVVPMCAPGIRAATPFQIRPKAKQKGRPVGTDHPFCLGLGGFEPPTPCPPDKYAKPLRYSPN